MEKQVETLLPAEAPTKRNRGWFQRGDARINLSGRPRGSKKAAAEAIEPADLAPCADRLMLLSFPVRSLEHRLTHPKGLWILNMPPGFHFVASRVDEARGLFLLTVRCDRFPRIAKGTPIPQFTAKFDGLRWVR